ncbi:MAG: hypothetical protein GY861_22480 [bacterium]|nr:hypothetical protein [bacterium]
MRNEDIVLIEINGAEVEINAIELLEKLVDSVGEAQLFDFVDRVLNIDDHITILLLYISHICEEIGMSGKEFEKSFSEFCDSYKFSDGGDTYE